MKALLNPKIIPCMFMIALLTACGSAKVERSAAAPVAARGALAAAAPLTLGHS